MRPETVKIQFHNLSHTEIATPSTPNTTPDVNSTFHPLARQDCHAGDENARVTDRGWPAWLAVVGGFINFWAGFGKLPSTGALVLTGTLSPGKYYQERLT